MGTQRFPLRMTRPWRWLLRLIGVRRGAAQVDLTDGGQLVATFGRLNVETELDNIDSYRLTGPYRWWKAIGPRGSLADLGFTFGTSTHGGVCVCFAEPVPSKYVRGGLMESLTITVNEPDRLARALNERGIEGHDERRR